MKKSLENYFTIEGYNLSISPNQASHFAKTVANDFNPLHDPDHRRFCVPGDLLFTIILYHFGISQNMQFLFSEMVGSNVELNLEGQYNQQYDLNDRNGKTYLKINRSNDLNHDLKATEKLIRSYVGFSGQNFPSILVPLFKKHKVMINIDRPIVIYQSMAFNLDNYDFSELAIELSNSQMAISGKRANVTISFNFLNDKKIIGTGEKKLVLGGLCAFEEKKVALLIKMYQTRRNDYQSQQRNL
tara:strand:- start:6411 stop:7139 length:729 start_codon:yes stop_codon:yes gene_type:complete